MEWSLMADYVFEVYGSYVDWDERFFLCPFCGEPIYEQDYGGKLTEFCPVCEELVFE